LREALRFQKSNFLLIVAARLASLALQAATLLLTVNLLQEQLTAEVERPFPIVELATILAASVLAATLEFHSEDRGFRLARAVERRVRVLVVLASRLSPDDPPSTVAKLKAPEVAGRLTMAIPAGVAYLAIGMALFTRITLESPQLAGLLILLLFLIAPIQFAVYRRGSTDTRAMLLNMVSLKKSVLSTEGRRKLPLDETFNQLEHRVHGSEGLAALDGLYGLRVTSARSTFATRVILALGITGFLALQFFSNGPDAQDTLTRFAEIGMFGGACVGVAASLAKISILAPRVDEVIPPLRVTARKLTAASSPLIHDLHDVTFVNLPSVTLEPRFLGKTTLATCDQLPLQVDPSTIHEWPSSELPIIGCRFRLDTRDGAHFEHLGFDITSPSKKGVAGVRILLDGQVWKEGCWHFSDKCFLVEKDWTLNIAPSRIELDFVCLEESPALLTTIFTTCRRPTEYNPC